MTSTPALSVSRLSVRFRSPPGSGPAVDDVSFDLREGEIAGLVGESGCGKSVTARALLGLIPPFQAKVTAASVRLNGNELLPLSDRSLRGVRGNRIAMIFQEPATALDPVFTVGHQINNVIRRHRGAGPAAARRETLQALERSGFSEPEQAYRSYPHHLSGGMRQLAMIAMAMAVQPRVLIADEPTTALDVTTQALVLDRLRHLRDTAGSAVLLVSHDLGVVASCCSTVLVMYCGRILEQAPYDALYASPRHPYTAGLLASVPRLEGGRGPVPIPGQVPALASLPPGCHFAPRCPRADDRCRMEPPALEPCDGRSAACHHPL
jgi:oligopeptide/dipeptide ABC transporter ATP-binding protein